jgi:serine/threonine protein kinase
MQKSFLSFLDQIGFTGLRQLSMRSEIHLCRERATGRLLVAKLWHSALAHCGASEAKALAALGPKGLAPHLGAILETDLGTVLLRPFVAGTTLYELKDMSMDRAKILAALKDLVHAIHAQGWAHRDLTPGNVIVSSTADLRIQILDWDLAEEMAKQDADSFSPRGTPGFSLAQRSKDLLQQDLDSLESIARFLGETNLQPERNDNPRRRPWWTDLFSARP